MKKIKVVELFAGVGGFRLGLSKSNNKNFKYSVVWSSQWEPGASKQHASDLYVKHFGGEGHSCEDIQSVIDNKFKEIPNHDLLVGGFPCQDYSVARTLKNAKGLEGKKGVLWWSIYNILRKKGKDSPNFLMLENVDRLLKSPSIQRGRDFAVMLSSLASLGYVVEWRVINAADYGFPQRRRRVFIMGYKKGTSIEKRLRLSNDMGQWMSKDGVIARAFPVNKIKNKILEKKIKFDPAVVSKEFSNSSPSRSPFENSGVMINGVVYTTKLEPRHSGKKTLLRDVLLDEEDVPSEFFVNKSDIKKWEYLKGAKKASRKSSTGHEYFYSEGSMAFPDSLDRPSRTIITGEGGASPSRFKHVIQTKSGKFRRLTPLELEMLCMFPKNHTYGVPDIMRAFIMGNALVVGVIEKLGKSLRDSI